MKTEYQKKKENRNATILIIVTIALIIFLFTIVLDAHAQAEYLPKQIYPTQDNDFPTYIELRREYAEYCTQTVQDTITEYGTIEIKIKIGDDFLKVISRDTIWREKECKEYKYYFNDISYSGLTLSTSSNITLSDYQTTWTNVDNTYRYISVEDSENSIITKFEDVERLKVCDCKRMRESSEGFWNWVEKTYLE